MLEKEVLWNLPLYEKRLVLTRDGAIRILTLYERMKLSLLNWHMLCVGK